VDQNELDTLYALVWQDRCPPEVLADWLMENVEVGKWVSSIYGDNSVAILMMVLMPELLPNSVHVRLECVNQDSKVIEIRDQTFFRDDFCAEFPDWLKEEMSWLYYVGASQ
jgi:hypothetical protein